MLKAKKEELQERGVKGFTLMEMLIVVAIIAILVAIAIPTFTGQLEKAKISADKANVRAWYAEVVTDFMTETSFTDPTSYGGETLQAAGAQCTITGTLSGGNFKVEYTNTASDGLVLD